PFHLHVAEQYASALALCDGDLAAADRAAVRSHEWSRLLTGRDASGVQGIQMFSIRREQGRLAELAPVMHALAGKGEGAWGPGLVAVLAELGMRDEAQRVLRRLVLDELDVLRQSLWLASLTYLADACAALGEAVGMTSLGARVRALGTSGESVAALPDGLTGREAEILRLVARGLSNRDIGRSLFVSEHTIANHVRSILRKTGCANRTEAAAYAHRRALVELADPR